MPHPVDLHVGRKLRQIRMMRNYSQTQVARELGLSFQQVQKYEEGSNRVSASRLFQLSEILGVAPEWFFEGIESDTSADQPLDEEAIRLAAAFARISDERVRDRIRSFVDCLSSDQQDLNDSSRRVG